jgi:hypothetical protein
MEILAPAWTLIFGYVWVRNARPECTIPRHVHHLMSVLPNRYNVSWSGKHGGSSRGVVWIEILAPAWTLTFGYVWVRDVRPECTIPRHVHHLMSVLPNRYDVSWSGKHGGSSRGVVWMELLAPAWALTFGYVWVRDLRPKFTFPGQAPRLINILPNRYNVSWSGKHGGSSRGVVWMEILAPAWTLTFG